MFIELLINNEHRLYKQQLYRNTAGLIDWTLFLRHLTAEHTVGPCLEKGSLELDEEIQAEVELELQNLSKIGSKDIDETTDSEADIDDHVSDETYLTAQPEVDDTDTREQAAPHVPHNDVLDRPNQPFYSMLHTKPELMLGFIDLLRQNEYLWREEYKNGDFAAERLESAQQISEGLEERFNVTLKPRVISHSVCRLLKWFQRQHALCSSNRSFRCRHQSYYDQLLQFVPTHNIHVMNCDECKRKFYNEEQLRRHKYRAHGGRIPYVCDVCHMGFSHASKLRMHRARHHEKPKRWQCTLCSYCAPNKWDLSVHLPTHSGERNYTCELCGVSTKSSSSLAVHRRTHSVLKINCPYCPKKYRENYLVNCHIKKMHAAELEQEQELEHAVIGDTT
nr:oocyte zinc finger protein XlCOF22 [Drosophila virilis]